MEWSELAGEGKVVGLTSIAIVPAAMAAKGFGRDRPYLTGVVALREGPSLAARLAVADGAGLEVGAPVRADFVEEGEGEDHSVTLVFRPE